MTNERWLKWAIARHYRSKGYKVSMKPVRAGNAIVDGMAIGEHGEKIAIEVKSTGDDMIRGIGQCSEALSAGYRRAVLVTALHVAKRLRKQVFESSGIGVLGVDAKARIHRYDADGWRIISSWGLRTIDDRMSQVHSKAPPVHTLRWMRDDPETANWPSPRKNCI